jgi:NAD(P)-dependent dehydrogenase (short-subunit alcohol dehydrogenase family)
MLMPLDNKTFVVTGATSGIGLAVVESLVRQNASVIGVGRDPDRCLQALEEVKKIAAPGARVAYLAAELSLQDEVRRLAARIGETLGAWGQSRLDGLINNAATVPFWQTLTPEGIDLQWAVNHLAAFLLTLELLPLLRAAPAGRIVLVSSGSHHGARLNWEDLQSRRHYNPLKSYGQTKLANVLFTSEFNSRFASGSAMRAFAADPGLVKTEIGFKSNSALARWIWGWRRRAGVQPEQAAKGIIFLAVDPSIQESPAIYWKNGKPRLPSSFALNSQAARQLWELSAQMCGVNR